jgi:hypothetical protein
MASELVQVGATIQCPHSGQATIMSSNVRVKASGSAVALQNDQTTVAGCSFMIGSVPSPCLMVQWLVPAVRVKVSGSPVLLKSSSGLCQGSAPQGPPSIQTTQVRVKGT